MLGTEGCQQFWPNCLSAVCLVICSDSRKWSWCPYRASFWSRDQERTSHLGHLTGRLWLCLLVRVFASLMSSCLLQMQLKSKVRWVCMS